LFIKIIVYSRLNIQLGKRIMILDVKRVWSYPHVNLICALENVNLNLAYTVYVRLSLYSIYHYVIIVLRVPITYKWLLHCIFCNGFLLFSIKGWRVEVGWLWISTTVWYSCSLLFCWGTCTVGYKFQWCYTVLGGVVWIGFRIFEFPRKNCSDFGSGEYFTRICGSY
jgi:hypothetical protein